MNTYYHLKQGNYKLQKLIIACFVFLFFMTANAQQWEYLGDQGGISAGGSSYQSMTKDVAGNIYISYYDVVAQKGSVQKYNGTSWSYAGGSAGITAQYALYNSLTSDALGNIYYTSQGSGMEVRKFDGSVWTTLPAVTSSTVNFQASAVTASGVLVAANNTGSGSVKRYVNGAWEQLGASGFAGGTPYYLDMVTGSDNTIYVSYVSNGYVYVIKNNINASATQSWEQVGGLTGIAPATSNEQFRSALAIDANNNIFIAYTSGSSGGNKLNVKKYNGLVWAQVGSENFTDYRVHYVNIAANASGVPYVVFSNYEDSPNNGNQVMKFNGSVWEIVGSNPISGGEAKGNVIIFDNAGNPVIAYADASTGKTMVRRYAGNSTITPVQSVSVATQNSAAAQITQNGGTLQLVASVLSAAAGQGVTWAITQGSAFATINQNGLVTATANGTITVTATSVQDTTKKGTITITITNQSASEVLPCNFATVAVTGFNADVIAEGTGANANAKATQPIDGANAYFTKDFVPQAPHTSGASAQAYGGGLPNNGLINSSGTTGLSYQLASYAANNALVLRNSLTNTGTLTFTEQKKAQKVYLVWVSAEGENNVTVTVNFADGTSQVFTAQKANDWWYTSPNANTLALGSVGRVSVITTANWAPVNSFSGLSETQLFQKEFILDAANHNKLITSIGFTKETSANAATTTAILAVSVCTPQAPLDATITGFNRDIIANGVGNASSSSEIGLDEVNSRALVSLDFKATAGSAAPTRGLPANGTISSANTAGVSYQLANYTGPNALYLTPSYVTGSINTVSSGTLSFQAQNKAKVYILYTAAGGGSSNLNYTATVNFSDGTSQAATLAAKDWYSGSGFAIKGIGRINRTNNNLEGDAENPRLYESVINLDTANQSKTITGVSFSFNGDQAAEYGDQIRLAILSVATAVAAPVTQGLVVTTSGGAASATISTNSGSVDLNAYQNDEYVADNDITWSIVPGGTGYANVGMYGVVTAVSNGTVTVRATLISNPSVYGDFPLTITGQVSGYCEVYFVNGCSAASIINVSTTGGFPNINNATSGCLGSNDLSGYSDYSSNVLGAVRNSTITFDFQFTHSAGYDPYLSAWIDWNHDFIFQESERVYFSASGESDDHVQFTATVPANAVIGQTKMRFKAVGGWEGSGACGTNSFGEIEDYTINIIDEGISPAVTITTQNNVPAEITVNDGTLQLQATVTPTPGSVTWSIVAGNVYGTVSNTGLVTALFNGTLTVRATLASNTAIYKDLNVTITNQIVSAQSVAVSVYDNAPATIITDQGTLQLIATVFPLNATNRNVTWSIIEGTGFATVSATGLVTATANGTITVRATSIDDTTLYDDIDIVISNQYVAVAGITVSVEDNAAATITVNEGTLQLMAEFTPADALIKDVTWTIISGSEFASVATTGLVTAIANGTITVRGTSVDNTTLYDNIDIVISNQHIAVTAIVVSVQNNAAATITTPEGTLQLVAEITPADATNASVTWTIVSGSEFASVSATGLVTASANGTVTVRATSVDNTTLYDEIEIIISNQYVAVETLIVSVEDNAPAIITTVDGTLKLEAAITPADATQAAVTWTIVSGSEFATVDANGIVTATANGTVVVRATSVDNATLYDEIEIVISNQHIAVISLQVRVKDDATPAITTANGTLELIAEITPADATEAAVIWTIISGSELATISEDGLVAAIANGIVVVRATSVDNTELFDEIEITISGQTLGREDFESSRFALYPNPTHGVATISAAGTVANVVVFNMIGQKVYESKGATVDLSDKEDGIYLIQATFEDGAVTTQKLIKK